MHDPLGVEEVETREDLGQESFDFRREEWLAHVVEERLQVVFEKVHDEEDTVLSGDRGQEGLSSHPRALGLIFCI